LRLFSARQSPPRQQKQSINHAGKETNALRRASASQFVAVTAWRLRAFAPPPRARSSPQRPTPAGGDPASC